MSDPIQLSPHIKLCLLDIATKQKGLAAKADPPTHKTPRQKKQSKPSSKSDQDKRIDVNNVTNVNA